MRTAVEIDDDLIMELEKQASKAKVPLSRVLNTVLREAMADGGKEHYILPEFSLGSTDVDLVKALELSASLEDKQLQSK